jgi:hypothetical protein
MPRRERNLALVHDSADIVADFREKSLRHTHVGTDAAVVFDALPGHVFRGHVTSSDAGVLAGQQAVNGELSEPETSNRWVRDAQRMRIHVALDDACPNPADRRAPPCSCITAKGRLPASSQGCKSISSAGCTMSINTLARVFTPHGNIVYTANDFRQTLRIVFAGMLALSISAFTTPATASFT